MSKTRQILIMAIIAAGAAAGLVAINPFRTSSVQANQAGTSGAQKWEYCVITDVHWAGGGLGSRQVVVIRYFQVGGSKEEAVEFPSGVVKSTDLKEALNKVIAKLGDEGWEMVLRAPDNGYTFYFKRPRQ
jgi:hypothetical protein